MTTHRVYYAKGDQTLRTIPHRDGRPVRVTSGTYAILDVRHGDSSADHTLVAPGTAATIDAVSTTLTAKAGRNATDRRALTLASTVGLTAGRTYILESSVGVAELLRVVAVTGPTGALAAREIRGDFPVNSTLKGVEVAATFPGAAADDEKNLDGLPWIIVWTFTGFPPIRESIQLERGEESQLATLEDLAELDPYLSTVGGDRIEPALALARAHKDWRTDLMLAGADEADYLSGPIGRDAVLYRAAWHSLHHSEDESAIRRAEEYGKRYDEFRAAVQVGSKKPGIVTLDKSEESATEFNPANLFKPFGWG